MISTLIGFCFLGFIIMSIGLKYNVSKTIYFGLAVMIFPVLTFFFLYFTH